MEHVLFTLVPFTAMGVETRVPDETALGVEYPNYDELSPEWKGQDRVFVYKELFDEMARGLFFCSFMRLVSFPGLDIYFFSYLSSG